MQVYNVPGPGAHCLLSSDVGGGVGAFWMMAREPEKTTTRGSVRANAYGVCCVVVVVVLVFCCGGCCLCCFLLLYLLVLLLLLLLVMMMTGHDWGGASERAAKARAGNRRNENEKKRGYLKELDNRERKRERKRSKWDALFLGLMYAEAVVFGLGEGKRWRTGRGGGGGTGGGKVGSAVGYGIQSVVGGAQVAREWPGCFQWHNGQSVGGQFKHTARTQSRESGGSVGDGS